MTDKPLVIPVGKLTHEPEYRGDPQYADEMARRLRKLDEEITDVEAMEHGHGIQHPFVFTERLRRILDGASGD